MKIDCGIIGLPNVGKSTLFNILTSISVKIANFPFCTINPNISIVPIPDTRIYQLAKIAKSKQSIYSMIEFIDIAGLIKGASQGEGLGDKTLSYIREAKVLCHVVRCFDDDQVVHVIGDVDPDRDVSIVNTELILFDILQCERNIFLLKKNQKIYSNKVHQKLFLLHKCLVNLNNSVLLRKVQFTHSEKISIQKFNFLTFKPIIYIANIDENQKSTGLYLNKLNIFASKENAPIVICCASSLLYDSNTKSNFNKNCVDSIIKKRKHILKNIINNIFIMLDLCTFFTINIHTTRAWVGTTTTTALEAANKVHSDFKRGFIRVQVIKYHDFITYSGDIGVKKVGKIYFEGKDYFVEDGDILKFLFKI